MSDYITAGQIYTVLTWQIAAIVGIVVSIKFLRRMPQTFDDAATGQPGRALSYTAITGFVAYILNAIAPPLTASWLGYRVQGADIWPVVTIWQLHVTLILTVGATFLIGCTAFIAILVWLAVVPEDGRPHDLNRMQIGIHIATIIYLDWQLSRFLKRWARTELGLKNLRTTRHLSVQDALTRTLISTDPPADLWCARDAINKGFRHRKKVNSVEVINMDTESADDPAAATLIIDWKVAGRQYHSPTPVAHP
ncbi:hypothetical protein BKG86_00760 [Mycobacteroides chelonae]|uniref:hypothetical protein n=1 Tax=Mycobacteroides chelonae TaxID=1774 RepID=UPI000911FF59|nr:hypothetical protein [Mycobacteroides chelonae]OHU72374.1 hypothetical protein BKG86_00760 [Mycobacteroides chelonae]